jgi:O-antigen/teichoic acid export membrane protein
MQTTTEQPNARVARTRRFFGGLRLSYLYQAVVMLAGLWLTPFLLNHLGQHDYGLWLVGLQTLSYLVLMDFGIVALLPRETAYATGHAIAGNAGHDLSELISRTARVVLYQTPLVAAAVVIVWFVVPVPPTIRGPVLIAMAGFVALFPLRIFQAVLQGLQETPYLGKLQFVSWTVSTGTMVLLILQGWGLYALAVGWVLGQLLPSVLSFYRLKTAFPGVLPSRLIKLTRQELFRAMSSGSWISVAQIAQILVAGTDFIIIGRVLGAAAVVPYAVTQKLIAVLANQPQMIMEMAMPGLSQMKTSESRENIFRVCNALTLSMLTLSGAVVCVYVAVNHSFVNWWIGASQFGGSALTLALAGCLLLRQWNTTSVYTIFALGYERRISITTLVEGIVNVAAAFGLVHWLGPIGAPLGSVLGLCLVSIPGNFSALAHEVQMPILRVAAPLWPWFWRMSLAAAFAALVGLRWQAKLPYIIGVACLIGGVYILLMLPMIMNSHLRRYLPSQVTRAWESLLRRLNWSSAPAVAAEVEVAKDSQARF